MPTACAHTPTREVALEAWAAVLRGAGALATRWRRYCDELATSWRGGDDLARPRDALLALSSWPRRRALGAMRSGALGALGGGARGAAWRVAWRVQALGAVGPRKDAGLTLKMKTRVGRPAAGSATWHHVSVRLQSPLSLEALHKLLRRNKGHELGPSTEAPLGRRGCPLGAATDRDGGEQQCA